MILSRRGWRTGELDPGRLDRERRDTQAHDTGGPEKYLPHGKLIHILAKLTHISAYINLFRHVYWYITSSGGGLSAITFDGDIKGLSSL